MCADAMHNANKMEDEVWGSSQLACVSEGYGLPPKLDMNTVMINTSKENE